MTLLATFNLLGRRATLQNATMHGTISKIARPYALIEVPKYRTVLLKATNEKASSGALRLTARQLSESEISKPK